MNNFEQENLINVLKSNLYRIVIFAVLVGIVTFTISNFFTPEYRTSVDLLVIQKQSADNVDAFGAAKSAEYLSTILNKAIYSSSFYNDVIDETSNIERSDFGKTENQIEKNWQKQVEAKTVGSTGIINLNVFYEDKQVSIDLAQSISDKVIQDGSLYHGGGDKVEIKVLSGPITSNNPVRPNVWINGILGVMVGAFIAIIIILINADKEQLGNIQYEEQNKSDQQIFYQEPANFA